MKCRQPRGLRTLAAIGISMATLLSPCLCRAERGSGMAQLNASDFLGDSRDTWDFGLGVNFAGMLPIHRVLDLRFDVGARWYEGDLGGAMGASLARRWGGQAGETSDGLRAIPSTLDLIWRLEQWSKGEFWVPYVGAGFGLYDFQASFQDAEGSVRKHNLFRAGWNVRAGVNLERTSGLFINFETALHAVDTPGHWTSLYDASVGVGASLPPR